MLHNTLVHTFDSNETSSNRSLDTKIFFSIANGFLNQLRIYQFIFLLFLHHMFFFFVGRNDPSQITSYVGHYRQRIVGR